MYPNLLTNLVPYLLAGRMVAESILNAWAQYHAGDNRRKKSRMADTDVVYSLTLILPYSVQRYWLVLSSRIPE